MPEAYHNYQRDLGYIIRWNQRKGIVPTLLMHACCGPCSTYCIEYLSQFFKITIFYYNPNIAPSEEYAHRVAEIRRFVSEFKTKYPVEFIEGEYDPKKFYDIARGLEDEKEGGKRCRKCFELRLGETARLAKEMGFDYFTTTLTISPKKDEQVLNVVAKEQGTERGGQGTGRNLRRQGAPQRLQAQGRQQAFHRAFRRIQPLPPKLLRLRLFKARSRRA